MKIFEYKQSSNFRRLFLLSTATVLSAAMLSGCMGQKEPAETIPDTQPPLMIETEPSETEPLITEATKPQSEANVIVDGKTITVTGAPVEVRSAVGADGLVMGKLEVGTQSEILRQVELDGIHWALVREGWICLDNVDLGDTPVVDDSDDDPSISVVPEETEPEKPAEPHRPSMGDEGNTPAVSGKTGVITARGLNVRAEPSTTAKVVDALRYGDKVTIIEQQGSWGRVKNGWISLNYVKFDGGSNTPAQKPAEPQTPAANVIAKGVVTVNGLNIRKGAGTNYDAVGSYDYGTRVEFVEKTTVDGYEWGKTNKGWIALGYVYMDCSKTDDGVNGVITGEGLNIRSGPGTGYASVGSYSKGDNVVVYAQFKFGSTTWGCTNKGWISMDYVNVID